MAIVKAYSFNKAADGIFMATNTKTYTGSIRAMILWNPRMRLYLFNKHCWVSEVQRTAIVAPQSAEICDATQRTRDNKRRKWQESSKS